jgi:hypothetical protein
MSLPRGSTTPSSSFGFGEAVAAESWFNEEGKMPGLEEGGPGTARKEARAEASVVEKRGWEGAPVIERMGEMDG